MAMTREQWDARQAALAAQADAKNQERAEYQAFVQRATERRERVKRGEITAEERASIPTMRTAMAPAHDAVVAQMVTDKRQSVVDSRQSGHWVHDFAMTPKQEKQWKLNKFAREKREFEDPKYELPPADRIDALLALPALTESQALELKQLVALTAETIE